MKDETDDKFNKSADNLKISRQLPFATRSSDWLDHFVIPIHIHSQFDWQPMS